MSNLSQKSLPKFGLKATKDHPASSPGQATYIIKISGYCQKKEIAKWLASFYFFSQKSLPTKKFLSEVFANWRTYT